MPSFAKAFFKVLAFGEGERESGVGWRCSDFENISILTTQAKREPKW